MFVFASTTIVTIIPGKGEVFSLLDIGCNEGDLSMELLLLAKSQLPAHVRCTLTGAIVYM